jgi:hypothetical protein
MNEPDDDSVITKYYTKRNTNIQSCFVAAAMEGFFALVLAGIVYNYTVSGLSYGELANYNVELWMFLYPLAQFLGIALNLLVLYTNDQMANKEIKLYRGFLNFFIFMWIIVMCFIQAVGVLAMVIMQISWVYANIGTFMGYEISFHALLIVIVQIPAMIHMFHWRELSLLLIEGKPKTAKPLVIGHRGGKNVANDIPTFKWCYEEGADGVELDVIISTDGFLFVFHPYKDEKFMVGGVEKSILECTKSEIISLREYTGHIPLLSEALAAIKSTVDANPVNPNFIYLVEVKDYTSWFSWYDIEQMGTKVYDEIIN